MAALANDEKAEEPTQTYQVTAKAFDEEMPMISVILKKKISKCFDWWWIRSEHHHWHVEKKIGTQEDRARTIYH